MNAVVFDHVLVSELPLAWREKLPAGTPTHVTVRIEEAVGDSENKLLSNPIFGMWRDREEMTDVAQYLRDSRAARAFPGSKIQTDQ
jgi:hypothetical protein